MTDLFYYYPSEKVYDLEMALAAEAKEVFSEVVLLRYQITNGSFKSSG